MRARLGSLLWQGEPTQSIGTISGDTPKSAPIAVDLDGDGLLEVLWGTIVHHHDGMPYFSQPELNSGSVGDPYNWPHVADLDRDGSPEVLLVRWYGGGRVLTATGDVISQTDTLRMAASIQDVDGDGVIDIVSGGETDVSLYTPQLTARWQQSIIDNSGSAAPTAFDFLGDGGAEVIYADENLLRVYDDAGTVLLSVPRDSWTSHESPVVADVDNDGSAEIVVVSNAGWQPGQSSPAVQVIRDAQDRWVGARRIWNQHSYHVTNVREDGTIPQHQPHHWELLNTFRVQAQLDNGTLCEAIPAG